MIMRLKYLISEGLRTIISFIRPLRLFHVYIAEHVTSYYEDPSCPSRWRGSGCYDIEVHALKYHRATVCAASMQEAIEAVEKYEQETIRRNAELKESRRNESPFGYDSEIVGAVDTEEKADIWDERQEILDSESLDDDKMEWSEKGQIPTLKEAIESFKTKKR